MPINYVAMEYLGDQNNEIVAGHFVDIPLQGVGTEAMWVVYAVATARDEVTVLFSNETVTVEALDSARYSIAAGGGSAARTITSVTKLGTHASVLTLDGDMTPGTGNYTVTVLTTIHDVFGRTVDPARDSYVIDGPAVVTPMAVFGIATSNNSAVMVFNTPMVVSEIETEANYAVTPDVGSAARTVALAVASPSGSFVFLTFDGNLTPGTDNYDVTVAGVNSQEGVPIDPANDTVTISGPDLVLAILSAVSIDEVTVRVTFNVPVLDNDALICVESYDLTRNDNSAPIQVFAVSPEAVTNPTYVDLTTEEQDEGTLYDGVLNLIEPA